MNRKKFVKPVRNTTFIKKHEVVSKNQKIRKKLMKKLRKHLK